MLKLVIYAMVCTFIIHFTITKSACMYHNTLNSPRALIIRYHQLSLLITLTQNDHHWYRPILTNPWLRCRSAWAEYILVCLFIFMYIFFNTVYDSRPCRSSSSYDNWRPSACPFITFIFTPERLHRTVSVRISRAK